MKQRRQRRLVMANSTSAELNDQERYEVTQTRQPSGEIRVSFVEWRRRTWFAFASGRVVHFARPFLVFGPWVIDIRFPRRRRQRSVKLD